MERKQNDHYKGLSLYMEQRHEKNRKRIKYSAIVILLLPVILGIVRWLTDSDKTVFLLIWVLCMFVLSAYLVSVEYIDHNMQKIVRGLTGGGEDYDSLVKGEDAVLEKVRESVKSKLDSNADPDPDSDTADDAEEGGDE